MYQNRIFLLKGKIQNYAWGGNKFIPKLLNIENKNSQPAAEYWLGAHPSATATVDVAGAALPLDALIKIAPKDILGKKTMKKFGELPYLLKILDVKKPLSIQVHPSKSEAEQGFDAEEAAGIPLNDKNRNYKDRNHKPEIMVALSEFWLLHGFLKKEKLQSVLQAVSEFKSFIPVFKKEGYKGLYQYVMELPQTQVDALLQSLVSRALEQKSTDKSLPEFWVRRLYENKDRENLVNIDRGIFSLYFFNIVKLLPDEAIFQNAGVPHAYLEGQNVELMANSDNVLRGGLTPKHIDVPELLKLTRFEGTSPNILHDKIRRHQGRAYPCPVCDFGISQIKVSSSETIENTSFSAEIIMVTEGEILIKNEKNILNLSRGEAVFILAKTNYIISSSARGAAFRAFVPKKQLSKERIK